MAQEKEESVHKYTFFTVQEVHKKNGKWMNQRTNELAAMVIKIPTTLGDHFADVNTTVVLPNGIHSLPHKGRPSSLIQRWKPGGSCDCGGWDMGCNLRILTNQSNKPRDISASTSYAFKLFCQSLLQAFSICIAVNEGQSPVKTTEPNERLKSLSGPIEAEATAKYLSQPPLSPVEGFN
ncbi:hypothetical protein Bca4012_018454 [Brassica carinata]|uniref:Uncharacterized protein n=1 Tax=Brassica carinata TaxID=52824 RepID=A0A8X8BFJ8_BRACI|nr:hypothetical protein Bca52824_003142 [Brassica carinata]